MGHSIPVMPLYWCAVAVPELPEAWMGHLYELLRSDPEWEGIRLDEVPSNAEKVIMVSLEAADVWDVAAACFQRVMFGLRDLEMRGHFAQVYSVGHQ